MGTIEIDVFMEHLRKNNLIIVNANEFFQDSNTGKNMKKSTALAEKELTLAEIADTRLLNVGSKQAIRAMMKKGIFKKTDYVKKNGIVYVATHAIKRVRKEREIK